MTPFPFETPTPSPVPFDPLRLCVYTTVALLAWAFGPWAVAFFATLGLVGYGRAYRQGLVRSRCKLGDTRLVLAYLALVLAGALFAIAVSFGRMVSGS